MALVDTKNLISISEANRLGVSGLIREAESGRDRIVLRNNRPVAAVVGINRLEELDELRDLEDDLLDLTLALARLETTSSHRLSLDEVFARFGYTREQLAAIADADEAADRAREAE